MDFRLGEDVERFRAEVQEFVVKEWHPDPAWAEDSAEYIAASKEFGRKLVDKGWFAGNIAKEHGGAGLSVMQQYVYNEVMFYYEAPGFGGVSCSIVAPTLIMFGSEEQKKRFLPRLVNAELTFCLGYTESAAGSDMAALQTTAVRDGDDFIINGQKLFTSGGHYSDYIWLAARTDPNAPKHKGISMFLVDMKSPGVHLEPLPHMGGYRTNITYLDEVRVPGSNLVGELNKGWYYIVAALDFERVMIGGACASLIAPVMDMVVDYAKETRRNGRPLKDDPDVRDRIARLSIDIEVGKLLAQKAVWMVSEGAVPSTEAAMAKVYNSELQQQVCYWGTQIQGPYGNLLEGSKHAPRNGAVEKRHEKSVYETIGGGTSEVLRNIIAQRGLGLPR